MAAMSRRSQQPSKPFTANYNGDCTGCSGEIVGDVDEIVMWKGEPYHNDEDCCEGLKDDDSDNGQDTIQDRWAD
jgi:hypothetical protein